jgi:hypothetical protein
MKVGKSARNVREHQDAFSRGQGRAGGAVGEAVLELTALHAAP